ncbi:helix-turn-helix domain-containing protein [Salinibacter altiplanensis]|uniref:helix-turn-helix domain-containing protein n=1 Tax=Salinibacter altiplanensis TaxID=1803181 RepID=UPI000C9F88E5|nr:helix-turn-helix domain-containing protein [Salinibacter altiplanensis]
MPSDTEQDILEEIQAQREELRALRQEVRSLKRGRDLVPLADLAEELGVARSTIYRRLEENGIPIRTAGGAPKEEGDRSAAYVSRSEWEGGKELHTRTVREEDGQYSRPKQ